MFSDIKIFDPLAKCYNAKQLKSIFATHEKEKKRSCNQRIIETENGFFTPLVFRVPVECRDNAEIFMIQAISNMFVTSSINIVNREKGL